MKITILQTGHVPASLRDDFVPYPVMFHEMFASTGEDYSFETVCVVDDEPLPQPDGVDAVLITGSAAGVYDDFSWMNPLRDFIRGAYAARTPMLGICFGHQIMADALGGDVRKSEKGWGLGRHSYGVTGRPGFMQAAPNLLAVACSHQDQVIVPPTEAEVILASEFTPNAGLAYRNGAALSFQPHPEFDDAYALALSEFRRGKAPDAVVDAAAASLSDPSHARDMAGYISQFFRSASR